MSSVLFSNNSPESHVEKQVNSIYQEYLAFRDNLLKQNSAQNSAAPLQYPPIVIAGPTASGKSSLAVKLAEICDICIINADSMQVYQEIPIISAQPSAQDQEQVPHRLYGYISYFQNSRFSVAAWLQDVMQQIQLAQNAQRIPVLVGGTGMYISALLHGLCETPPVDPDIMSELEKRLERDGIKSLHEELALVDKNASEMIHNQDKQRILRTLGLFYSSGQRLSTNYNWKTLQQSTAETQIHNNFNSTGGIGHNNAFLLYLQQEREQLYTNINKRVINMLENGLIQEITRIKENPCFIEEKSLPKAIGVREILDFLEGKISQEQTVALMQQKTRNFAKRQHTWFKNQLNFHLKLNNIH